jgi:Protein of unknown function (DUF2911)
MKYFVRHLSVGLLIVALTGVAAFGKGKTKSATVTFSSDVTVSGTAVKAGDYKIQFNEETGELSLLKGSKALVKTTGTLQARTDKARSTTMNFRDNQLVSVAFGGERQDVVLGQSGSTNGSDQ